MDTSSGLDVTLASHPLDVPFHPDSAFSDIGLPDLPDLGIEPDDPLLSQLLGEDLQAPDEQGAHSRCCSCPALRWNCASGRQKKASQLTNLCS